MSLNDGQKLVLNQIIYGSTITGLIILAIYHGIAHVTLGGAIMTDAISRLFMAIIWSILPAATLMAGIGTIARKRFFGKAIDPLSGNDTDPDFLAAKQYLSNTLEQVVLFVISLFAFSLAIPAHYSHLIPVLCVGFLLGRIIFYIGYQLNPLYRGIGFVMTFYPTVAMILYTIGKVLGSIITYIG